MESQFLQELQGLRLDLEKEDSWIWKDVEFLAYSVKSAYVSLRREIEGENRIVYDKFWRCKALPSAHVTTWRAMSNKIATRVNLEKRGVEVESLSCSLCGKQEESSWHLFF